MVKHDYTSIKLASIDKQSVVDFLLKCGTSQPKVVAAFKKIGTRRVAFGFDGSSLFTIVKVGEQYGVSKRCTYRQKNRCDEPKVYLGFTLALFRALGIGGTK